MGFIYSLTNRSFSLMRGLFTILFGVALILWPEHLHKIIIMVVASFSVAAGLISTLVLMKSYKVEQETGIIVLKIINIVMYMIIGVLIFAYPDFFISILTFFLGAVLIIFGVSHLLNLIFSSKHASVPSELYVMGIIITLCGIALFFNPFKSINVLMIFFGAILILYALSEFISAWKLRAVKFSKEGEFINDEEVDESLVNNSEEQKVNNFDATGGDGRDS
jgi:uncharacterized membrane protein HdeD (DUF308 family)